MLAERSLKPQALFLLRLRAYLALAAVTLAGCQAGYVLEQGYRQLSLNSAQIPLDAAELREKLPPDSLEKLQWVPEILRFCRDELALDPGDSYQTFLEVGGRPLSYIVMASHPLALVAYEWSFPFIGSVPYKGFFELEDARHEALCLEAERFETVILPVAAYSTLGWFRDPVLSTMLEDDLPSLVDIVIHEATHRTVYFPDMGTFNESLASHVAREGTVRFLFAHPALRGLVPQYLAARSKVARKEKLLLRLRNDLDALYRSPLPDEEKLARKAEVFDTAREAYRLLDPTTDDVYLPRSNAHVLSVACYHEHDGLLLRLEEFLGGNPSDLVAYLKELPHGEDPVQRIEDEIAGAEP